MNDELRMGTYIEIPFETTPIIQQALQGLNVQIVVFFGMGGGAATKNIIFISLSSLNHFI